MKENKKDNQTTALRFISEVAGRGKLYIVILLLVQMVLGISSVFYALLLRGIIDAAVSHDKDGMLLHILLFAFRRHYAVTVHRNFKQALDFFSQ